MHGRDIGDDIARQLKPGDVLLFHGHGAIPWAIRRFDESDVDHAAIVLDPPDTLAEATGSGIRHVSVRSRVDASAFAYVRRLARDADASSTTGAVAALEVSEASSVHERLILLAILAMTRRLPIAEPSLRRLLRGLLDRATDVVATMAARGRRLMLSSDLPYRAYRTTGDPALSLEILFPSEKPSFTVAPSHHPGSREAVLLDWASTRPTPEGWAASSLSLQPSIDLTVRRAELELEPLIEGFARVDASRGAVEADPTDEPSEEQDVTDDELHRSAMGFRDQVVRLALASDLTSREIPDHAWGAFRAVAACVTPGDLRYSPSLRTVTSLRPRAGRAVDLTGPPSWPAT